MKNVFKNQNGQVKWGIKFLSVVLIWEVFVGILMLLVSWGISALLTPFLEAQGYLGADGLVIPEYSETINNAYFIGMMCVQSIILILLCLGAWKAIFRLPLSSMGLRGGQWAREVGFGFLVGAGMISMVCVIIYVMGGAQLILENGINFNFWLLLYMVMFIFVGFGEEIAFRGYAMGTLVQTGNQWLIVLLPAIMFGVAHRANDSFSWLSCFNIILAGIFLGLLYWRSGRLWLSIGFHIAWNFFQGCVFGFEVSGISTDGILTSTVSRPGMLNGGNFGPEGSIPATVVLLAGIIVMIWYGRGRKSGFMEGGK